MANNNFILQLTSNSPGDSNYYTVTYTTASVYIPVVSGSPAYLPHVGSLATVVADQQATAFKLANYPGGDCNTCNTSSVAIVPPPPSPSTYCYGYSVVNNTSSSLNVSYVTCSGAPFTSSIASASFLDICVFQNTTVTGAGLSIVNCSSSCGPGNVFINCNMPPTPVPPPPPAPPVYGWAITQCTGSNVYYITFNTTSSITVGTVVSGSDYSGCYYVSASYTGSSSASFNFISSSIYKVYADCAACAYQPPPYKWYASNGYATAFDACIGQFPNQILWSNSASIVNTQTFMYTDPALTIPFSSTPFFYSYSRTGTVGDGSWTAGLTSYFAPGMVSNSEVC
jgi:hypothetical protein